MAELFDWDRLAANNNSAPPNGFPEGQTPSTLNNAAREVMAVLARWYQATSGILNSTGAVNAYELSVSQVITSYSDAIQTFTFRAHSTNSGASTLNINSVGASALLNNNGQQLPGAAIQLGGIYTVVWTGTEFRIVNSNTVIAPPPNTLYYPYDDVGGTYPATTISTWNKPQSMTRARITVCGGGGGGEAGANNATRGGGGGGASTIQAVYDADDLPDTVTVTVGSGGSGGINSPQTFANNGQASSFGALLISAGGSRPGDGVNFAARRLAGVAGTTTIASSPAVTTSVIFPGNDGEAGRSTSINTTDDDLFGATGGSTYFGAGRSAVSNSVNFISTGQPEGWGAGGGGSTHDNTNATLSIGHRGAGGIIIIEELF